jgi:hypothetical protein
MFAPDASWKVKFVDATALAPEAPPLATMGEGEPPRMALLPPPPPPA